MFCQSIPCVVPVYGLVSNLHGGASVVPHCRSPFFFFMKTASNIQDEIREIEREIQTPGNGTAIVNRLKSKREKLIICFRYLQSNPTEEFIKTEIARLQNRIEKIDADIDKLIRPDAKPEAKKAVKKMYYKEYNVSKIEEQLSTLNYLYE